MDWDSGQEVCGKTAERARAHARIEAALEKLFLAKTPVLTLVLLAGLPTLAATWLLLSPAQLLSREMTWDLLFNLAGAWAVHTGQTPHVDFHDPLGALNFALTHLGFYVTGVNPLAFLVAQCIVLVFTFLTALAATHSRLPPIPAAVFVLYVSALVLMPTNVGDTTNVYSFAMSYNRWCWSTLSTLCLIVFVPPRTGQPASVLDAATVGLLLVAMFYLKLTYAAVGLTALILALVISSHIHRRWRLWTGVAALVLVNVVAPYNHAYLADFWHAVNSGYVRSFVLGYVRLFFNDEAEFAIHLGAMVLLVWLWLRGSTSLRPMVAAGFMLCTGAFLLSQNAQTAGIPLGIVIACLLYSIVSDMKPVAQPLILMRTTLVLATILLFPILSVGSSAATIFGYHMAAQRDARLLVVDHTNLRGLAVPQDEDTSPDTIIMSEVPHEILSSPILSSARETRPRYELTQAEYVESLLEAAAFFVDGQYGRPKIYILDQVNPLPFILGYPAPRGINLWSVPDDRPAEVLFGDVDYLLLPKYPTHRRDLVAALTKHSRYFAANFAVFRQTPKWTILNRR